MLYHLFMSINEAPSKRFKGIFEGAIAKSSAGPDSPYFDMEPAEVRDNDGNAILRLEVNAYQEPYIARTSEGADSRTLTTLFSPAGLVIAAACDQVGEYGGDRDPDSLVIVEDEPARPLTGLDVEISGDKFGLRRYHIPDEPDDTVTCQPWRRTSTTDDYESAGRFMGNVNVNPEHAASLRKLMLDMLAGAEELIAAQQPRQMARN